MIILFGASASGKTEVAKYLARAHNIKKAITHTTRKMRESEANGVDYYFVTKQKFLEMETLGELVESTFYNGNLYGCSVNEVADDKCIVVDPAGLDHFLNLPESHIMAFYLDCNEELRRQRMISRGDNPGDIEKRLENDRLCFDSSVKEKADVIIQVDGKTVEEIGDFIYSQYRKMIANPS